MRVNKRTFLLLAAVALVGFGCSLLTPGKRNTSGEFAGFYSSGFEVSSFVPCDMIASDPTGPGYWLNGTPDFYQRYSELSQQSGYDPATGYLPVFTRFKGELSPAGSYGHMGAYSHEITVTKMLEMSLDGSCP